VQGLFDTIRERQHATPSARDVDSVWHRGCHV
jgi:hypothetical protein